MSTPRVKPGQHGATCLHCGSTRLKKDGHDEGRARWKCLDCGKRTTAVERDSDTGIDQGAVTELYRRIRRMKGRKRFVITSAQNATPVNRAFLDSLLGYCKHERAQLIVIPYRYKNPTSHWSKRAKADDWWAEELKPYLLNRRLRLNKHLTLLADIKTQPTATSPLQGFESITGPRSAIIGHPKLELTTVPTPQEKLPKILTTTGAVTRRNYIPSKAGKQGEFHHTFGACVVEIDGSTFHLRQLNAVKDGSFMDLCHEYAGATRREHGGISALAMGDSHVEFIDPKVVKATFGPGGIVETLKPKQLVWHDAFDNYAPNFHHHKHEVITRYLKHHSGRGNIEAELERTYAFIDKHTPAGTINVFPYSNHPGWLAAWVKETDPRADLENCVFWARTFEAMCVNARFAKSGAETIDPFSYWAERKLKSFKQARFLDPDQSYMIEGIECGMHGHFGPNGARGSIKAFGRIGVRSITGHGHAPGIYEGHYRLGTNSLLRLEYTHGPSSWLHTDCAVYPNGKRSLISIINGKWRA